VKGWKLLRVDGRRGRSERSATGGRAGEFFRFAWQNSNRFLEQRDFVSLGDHPAFTDIRHNPELAGCIEAIRQSLA